MQQSFDAQGRPLFFVNRKKPVVTWALIILSVAVFALDEVSSWIFGAPLLTLYGAKVNEAILAGQLWRFVTPLFLHGGITHLVCNMFALYVWGRQLEALLGRGKYLLVYFGAGILGCAASFSLSSAWSVGASGAIFGLFGALLCLRRDYRALFNMAFGVQVLIIIAFNVVNGFLSPGIDNFGHLGGLAGGYLITSFTGFYNKKTRGRLSYLAVYLLMFIILLLWRLLR